MLLLKQLVAQLSFTPFPSFLIFTISSFSHRPPSYCAFYRILSFFLLMTALEIIMIVQKLKCARLLNVFYLARCRVSKFVSGLSETRFPCVSWNAKATDFWSVHWNFRLCSCHVLHSLAKIMLTHITTTHACTNLRITAHWPTWTTPTGAPAHVHAQLEFWFGITSLLSSKSGACDLKWIVWLASLSTCSCECFALPRFPVLVVGGWVVLTDARVVSCKMLPIPMSTQVPPISLAWLNILNKYEMHHSRSIWMWLCQPVARRCSHSVGLVSYLS